MAKLSARGRKAQVEVSREYTESQLQAANDHRYPEGDPLHGPSLTTWDRVTRRLMSDGTILEKRDCRFRKSAWESSDRYYSYGWKVHGKLKTGLTAIDFARIYRADGKSGGPSLWTVTESGIGNTVILSQARIRRAIESGESVGFCLDCGSEQDGCEPDATGYKCENCGHMAVCGAEKCLIAC